MTVGMGQAGGSPPWWESYPKAFTTLLLSGPHDAINRAGPRLWLSFHTGIQRREATDSRSVAKIGSQTF